MTKKFIFCLGKNGNSIYVDKAEGTVTKIDKYYAIFCDEGGDVTILSESSVASFAIVTNGKKPTTVVLNKNGEIMKRDSYELDGDEFSGKLVLIYHCAGNENAFSVFSIKGETSGYSSITIDSYGLDLDNLKVLKAITVFMAENVAGVDGGDVGNFAQMLDIEKGAKPGENGK